MEQINLSILGSTGSIGTQTLEVVRQYPDRFCVKGLAAGSNLELLARQIVEFNPEIVSIEHPEDVSKLHELADSVTDIYSGDYGNELVASLPQTDRVVIATPGLAGIPPTLAAVKGGKDVCLATKEVLVAAGPLFKETNLIPVDSEHSAIFQILQENPDSEVAEVILTCSGGPFRGKNLDELAEVTLAQALKHPKWSMGNKISIDSATLMNKGLEVIEAHYLFNQLADEQIRVVVHPQSILHGAVKFVDGNFFGQFGPTDMKHPIQYALFYPTGRMAYVNGNFDPFAQSWDFAEPDVKTFKCLRLARQALAVGGTATAILTAANDVAVACFLRERIPFLAIGDIVEEVLNRVPTTFTNDLFSIREADTVAREEAKNLVTNWP